MPARGPVQVIVNSAAGGGRGRRLGPLIAAQLGHDDVLVQTEGPRHATDLAAAAARDGYSRVVAVGGDGTIQEVVNGLLAAADPPALGIIPAGSGNDLARSLRLPLRPEVAMTLALAGAVRTIDIGRARAGDGSTGHFVSAGGIGFDAQVAAAMAGPRRRWRRGALGYLFTTLAELRSFENRRLELVIDDDRQAEATMLLAAVTNGPYYGGGMRICPEARLDDGLLDVCLIGDVSRLEALRQLPGLYRGRHVGHPAVTFLRVRSLTVRELDATARTRTHLDGEPFGPLPMRVEIIPSALPVAAV